MRVLALDWGERRIGVAVTDPTGVTAQPLETVARSARGGAHLDRIAELVTEYEVSRVVVGLPIHMDGRRGPEAEAAHALGDEVAKRTGLPVDYVDERWTSREAERTLASGTRSPRSQGRSAARRRRERGRVDAVAASLILQTWLAREGSR